MMHHPYSFFINDNFPLVEKVRNRLYSSLIPDGVKSVLEVGSGKGEFARYCRDNGIDYAGIEPNIDMCFNLNKQGFLVDDMRLPEFPGWLKYEMDLVFCAHVIEHLDYETIIQFLHNYKKIGRILLLYPDIEKSQWTFYMDYQHTYVTSLKRVRNMLEDCGYRIEREGYYIGCITFAPIVWVLGVLVSVFPWWILPRKMRDKFRGRFQTCAYSIARA